MKTEQFEFPILKKRNGTYKIPSGEEVFVCFSSDFLLEEADEWRGLCWKMIKERNDLHFIFLTKRIERFMACIPEDWGLGYNNVTIGCTVENQDEADKRLQIFKQLPIKHKNIICQPLLEKIDIRPYLDTVELVVVGGESDREARPLHYDWVLALREQCIDAGTHFEFRQCGTHFVKDKKEYKLNVRELCHQARKAAINF